MEKVKDFISNENNSVEEYQEMVHYYYDLENKIIIDNDLTVYTTFFEINRKDFLETIGKTVESLKNILLSELVSQYQEKSKR